MTETRIRLAGMLGSPSNPAGNLLEVRFRTAENGVLCIEIPEAILGGLMVALRVAAGHIAKTDDVHPMAVELKRLFVLQDGRLGLELLLENVIRLPMVFPKEMVPALRTALDELEVLSRQFEASSPPRWQ
jgi:hypothetical protein